MRWRCPDLSSTAGACWALRDGRPQLLLTGLRGEVTTLLRSAWGTLQSPEETEGSGAQDTATATLHMDLGRQHRGEYSEAMQQTQEYAT